MEWGDRGSFIYLYLNPKNNLRKIRLLGEQNLSFHRQSSILSYFITKIWKLVLIIIIMGQISAP